MLLGVLAAALLAGRWLARDLRTHPANFPAPSPSHGLRMAITNADGRPQASVWPSRQPTEDER